MARHTQAIHGYRAIRGWPGFAVGPEQPPLFLACALPRLLTLAPLSLVFSSLTDASPTSFYCFLASCYIFRKVSESIQQHLSFGKAVTPYPLIISL